MTSMTADALTVRSVRRARHEAEDRAQAAYGREEQADAGRAYYRDYGHLTPSDRSALNDGLSRAPMQSRSRFR